MDQDVIDRIVEMREAGQSRKAIADALKVTINAVEWVCLVHGAISDRDLKRQRRCVPIAYKRGGTTVRKFTPDEDAMILRLKYDGMKTYPISKAIGRTASSVRARILTLARHDAIEEERG